MLLLARLLVFSYILPSYFLLSPNGIYKIHIGYLSDDDISSEAQVIDAAATWVRLNQFNQNSSLIHPNLTLILDYMSPGTSAAQVLTRGFQYITANITLGMIGTETSGTTTLLSQVLQPKGIPICSGGATSPSLGDKTQFPNFFSSIPNDNVQALVFLDLCFQLGWTEIFIVHTDEPYGQGLFAAFNTLSFSTNVTVVGIQKIPLIPSDSDISDAIRYIKSLSVKIFFLFTQVQPGGILLRALYENGLWISGYSFVFSDANTQIADFDPSLTSMFEDALVITPLPGIGSLYTDFQAAYAHDSINTPFANHSGFDPVNLTPYSGYFVNCLEMFVYGYDRLMKTGLYTVNNLIDSSILSNVSVPGTFSFPDITTLTGRIGLDANGENKGSYGVMNVKDGKMVTVSIWSQGVFSPLDKNTKWPGGVTDIPTGITDFASIANKNSHSPVFDIASFLLGLLGVIATCATVLCLFVLQKKKRVKALGPLATSLMLLGVLCGYIDILFGPSIPTYISCQADPWFLALAFSLFYGVLLVKMRRFYFIFRCLPVETYLTNDYQICAIGFLFSVPIIVFLTIWAVIDPPIVHLSISSSSSALWMCASRNQSSYVAVLSTYQGIIMAGCSYYVFKTKNAPAIYRMASSGTSVVVGLLVGVLSLLMILSAQLPYQSTIVFKLVAQFSVCTMNLFFHAREITKSTASSDTKKHATNSARRDSIFASKTDAALHAAIKSEKNFFEFGCSILLMKKSFNASFKQKFFIYSKKQFIVFLDYVAALDARSEPTIGSSGQVYVLKFLKQYSLASKATNQRYTIEFSLDGQSFVAKFRNETDYQEGQKIFEAIALDHGAK